MAGMLPLTARQSWKALQAHHEKIRELHLRTMFADDAVAGLVAVQATAAKNTSSAIGTCMISLA